MKPKTRWRLLVEELEPRNVPSWSYGVTNSGMHVATTLIPEMAGATSFTRQMEMSALAGTPAHACDVQQAGQHDGQFGCHSNQGQTMPTTPAMPCAAAMAAILFPVF
jgi:hypothetical protein